MRSPTVYGKNLRTSSFSWLPAFIGFLSLPVASFSIYSTLVVVVHICRCYIVAKKNCEINSQMKVCQGQDFVVLFRKLNWISIHNLVKFRKILLVVESLRDEDAKDLRNLFTFARDTHGV